MAINSTSLTNTPQAGDDSYNYTESTLLASSSFNNATNVIKLDVMSNDLGGNAKKLFSIDDGGTNTFLNDLLTNNVNTSWETTANGNQIRIVNGQIEFDITHSLTLANGAGNANVNALSAGETITDSFVYTIQLGNGTLSWATVNFTLVGENDSATITVNGTPDTDVIEAGGVANGTPGDPSASGDLNIVDLDAGEAKFQAVAPANLVGTYGNFAFDSDTGTWSYTLDNTDADTQALNTTDVGITDTLTVTSLDGTDSETITVNIAGANDAAVITGSASDSVTEASGVLNGTPGDATASGDLDATDVDNSADFVPQTNVASTYGTFSIDAGGAWSYTLDDDNGDVQALNTSSTPLHDLITVATADGTEQVIDVTINGANDAAIITGDTSDTVDEDAVPNTVSGNLDSTDVDNANDAWVPVAAGAASDEGYGSYEVDAVGNWTYTLDNSNAAVDALNESSAPLTDTFTVSTVDGTEQEVTITITGTNDAAVITGSASDSVTEATSDNPGTPTATGDLLATDVDNVNDVFQIVAPGAATANGYGTYGVTAAGVWTYTLDNTNATVNALNNGGALTDSFTVLSQDGTAQVVNITINGATDNQAPTAINLSTTTVQENSLNVLLGTLSTVDPDNVSGFTYTLTDNAGGRFELLNGNEIHVARGDLLDYEVATSHQITVQVVDMGGASHTENLTINLTDMVPVAPTGGADIIDGTSGSETISGGSGNDRVYGGESNDTLNGGDNNDALYGQGGDDTLNGDANNEFVLDGGAGNDILNGGANNDVLIGGLGADTMNGNANNDRFIWRAEDAGTGVDVINGFGTGTDTLQIGDVLTGYSGGSTVGFVQVLDSGGNALVQVDANGGGDNWTTLVQVNSASVASVTAALDLTTYTRTDHIG